MKRLVPVIALVAVAVTGAWTYGQSLGDAAAREKARRKALPPAKTYTNDDLAKPSPSPSPSPEAEASADDTPAARARRPVRRIVAQPNPVASGQEGSGGEGHPSRENSEGSSSASAGPGSEEQWRARAEAIRNTLKTAPERISALEARIGQLRLDRDPNPPDQFDPNRITKRAAEIVQDTAEIDKIKAEIAQAQQAQEDLEAEARRLSIPPGWLR